MLLSLTAFVYDSGTICLMTSSYTLLLFNSFSACARGAFPFRKPFISTCLISSSTVLSYCVLISLHGIVMANSTVRSVCFVTFVFICIVYQILLSYEFID